MFTSLFNLSKETLSNTDVLICLFSALILGLIIAFTYMYCETCSKNFTITLVLLPILVQIVIMLVNGNLGTGMAVLGAFSLVRFRSAPGNSKEICFIFFSMAMGLATGMGFIVYGGVTTIIICAAFILLSKTSFGVKKTNERKLKITMPENLDYTEVFNDLFAKYTKKYNLEKIKTTNLGSMFEITYKIVLKNLGEEKAFIDELRCRNGNLTIISSRYQTSHDEF